MELIANRAPLRALARASLAALVALAGMAACASPPVRTDAKPPPPGFEPEQPTFDSGWSALMYVPNRLFDVTDVVRMQVRVGPGWALGLRATRFVPLFIGGYNTTWVGVPGPRNRAKIPLPFGFDSQGGFVLGGGEYGVAEFGACVHLFMIGFDVGVDPRELVDLGAGFGGADISSDDF